MGFEARTSYYYLMANKVYKYDESKHLNSLTSRQLSTSVDLDEVAHNEPPHLDIHCLSSSL